MWQNSLLRDLDDAATKVSTPCGDGEMVWRRWGDRDAPVVVLIHGGAGAWSHWVRNIEPLTEHFQVISPDLPGLGESSSPPTPYSPESIADIAAQGLEGVVNGGAFSIVGFSFGGI
nr:alpha/beta fold hydrolase [Gammaproteobacteria bacterium]